MASIESTVVSAFKSQLVSGVSRVLKCFEVIGDSSSLRQVILNINKVYAVVEQFPAKTILVSEGGGMRSLSIHEICPHAEVDYQWVCQEPRLTLFDKAVILSYKEAFEDREDLNKICALLGEFKFNPTSFAILQRLVDAVHDARPLDSLTVREKETKPQVLSIKQPSPNPNARFFVSNLLQLPFDAKKSRLPFYIAEAWIDAGELHLIPDHRQWILRVSPVTTLADSIPLNPSYLSLFLQQLHAFSQGGKASAFKLTTTEALAIHSEGFNAKIPGQVISSETDSNARAEMLSGDEVTLRWSFDSSSEDLCDCIVVESVDSLYEACNKIFEVPYELSIPITPQSRIYAEIYRHKLEYLTCYKIILADEAAPTVKYVLFPAVKNLSTSVL